MVVAVNRSQLVGTAVDVAPKLLGAVLVSTVDGAEVRVRVTEVEAYEGSRDEASHAYRGQTKRNAVMFGEAGHLYCYFVYGMHWCANITCGPPGNAAAVLLRAAEIVEGEATAAARSSSAVPAAKLASGPARLARCLGLTGAHTGIDVLDAAAPVHLQALGAPGSYLTGPRVGVAVAADHPWRFWLPEESSVSAYRPGGRKRVTQARQTKTS